jgi:hypothetical protein
MEERLNALTSIGNVANPHAMASRMALMAHNNAPHPTIPAIPDADRVDYDHPSPPGGVSALPAQHWTGVDPSQFSPKHTTPHLSVDASGPPKHTAPQLGVDASGPQLGSTLE